MRKRGLENIKTERKINEKIDKSKAYSKNDKQYK